MFIAVLSRWILNGGQFSKGFEGVSPHPTLPLSKHEMGERSFRLSKDQAGSSLEFMDEVGCSASLLLTAVDDLQFHQTWTECSPCAG